jgi:hypothetical protein
MSNNMGGLRFNTSGTSDAMNIIANGNVGINQVSPSSILHAKQITNAAGFYLESHLNDTQLRLQIVGSTEARINSTYASTGSYLPMTFLTSDAERMRITTAGNVGIGTSSPNVSSQGANNTLMTIQGQSGSYGMLEIGATTNTAESLIGVLGFTSTNVTGGLLGFISMAAEGTTGTNVGGRIQFNTKANGGGLTERMRITSGGNVRLYITPTVDTNIEWYQTPANIIQGRIWTDGNPRVNVQCGGSQGVYLASGGVAWIANSDERLKTDLVPIEDAINKVNSLRSVIGRYKTDEVGTKRTFLIAQDLIKVLPEVVTIDEKTGDLGVSYSEVIPLLVAAIKELKAEIEELKNK